MNKNKRSAFKALLISMILPGMGQIYNGEVPKGLTFFIFFILSVPTGAWLSIHGPNAILWVFVVLGALSGMIFWIYSCVDAYRRAKDLGDHYHLQPYNKSYVYIAIYLFTLVFIIQPIMDYTKNHLIQIYSFPSKSMSPTIKPGDLFFADKSVNSNGNKRIMRGDIVTFINPQDRTLVFAKRVIGLPGDKIEMSGYNILVNNKTIILSQSKEGKRLLVTEKSESGQTYQVQWEEPQKDKISLTVPAGQAFLLGDNRSLSRDSRQLGSIYLADILGVAKQLWFSKGKEQRIGKWIGVN